MGSMSSARCSCQGIRNCDYILQIGDRVFGINLEVKENADELPEILLLLNRPARNTTK
jgi:hypothetical protein